MNTLGEKLGAEKIITVGKNHFIELPVRRCLSGDTLLVALSLHQEKHWYFHLFTTKNYHVALSNQQCYDGTYFFISRV